jgi:S-formylglutathione hydrolase FrmB
MNRGVRSLLLTCAVFLAILGRPPVAHAAGRAECRSLPSKILSRSVSYCVLLPPSYNADKMRRYPVLYLLHGLGENAETLIDSGGMNLIDDLRERGPLGEFVIATPDGDRSFYINSRDGRVLYEDFFVREFMPFIEGHYRIRTERRYRGISGVSMGGYGALRLALRYPQMFGSVSAHSAALVEKLPTARFSASQEAVLSRVLGTAFGTPPNRAFWERNSPFTLARDVPPLQGLRIYFDCGTEDDYGFNAGAKAFHELLVSRGIPHEFHLYPGGHNWSYVAQHLAASLLFHSHAFGLGPREK